MIHCKAWHPVAIPLSQVVVVLLCLRCVFRERQGALTLQDKGSAIVALVGEWISITQAGELGKHDTGTIALAYGE